MAHRTRLTALGALVMLAVWPAVGAEVHVRFQLLEPEGARYFVRLGGFIHISPWYLPKAVWPEKADRDPAARIATGEFTPWFDLSGHAGKRLHKRLSRAGGVAELPNVTVDFVTDPADERRQVVIEIATAPHPGAVVKRLEETYPGSLTSFLVSPNPARDAEDLETAGEMTARRLQWAREASGGRRISPEQLIVQTSFWGPQRPELNLLEAEVLWLLGFNVVGNQRPEVLDRFDLREPGHTHGVKIGPGTTREEIDALMQQHASRAKRVPGSGVPFNFSDEVVCRPRIGTDERALAHFHAWLEGAGPDPAAFGVEKLTDVRPIETPDELRPRLAEDEASARRAFIYTSRFRQEALTQRLKWHTEAFHRHFGDAPLTSTLFADHPYFAGTGLGMGMKPDAAWGNYSLAGNWFAIAHAKAVDLMGIEDWMGLQFMYGPNYTWEGFQLMGFQAAIFRSGGRGKTPIIAWITPSDETNLRLKTASALCQGAKHFFYWTYGPTCTSTENYWSDLRGAYDGVAVSVRQLAAAEHVIAPGSTRPTRVALLYSLSADLWQPFGYVHMLERRTTYLALVHEQYLVDMITEEGIATGRLSEYDCLYATDPCISDEAVAAVERWVRDGGCLYGSCAAGSLNEFGEVRPGLADVFGITPGPAVTVQPGRYHVRGALNGIEYLDEIDCHSPLLGEHKLGVIGAKVECRAARGTVTGTFADGAPAVVESTLGKGRTVYIGACPGIAYAKEARFVPRELKEEWSATQREPITAAARARSVARLVELSHPVVEAGVYDAPSGTALVLANFTYRPISGLRVRLGVPKACRSVRSVTAGLLPFTPLEKAERTLSPEHAHGIEFSLDLGLSDIVVIE